MNRLVSHLAARGEVDARAVGEVGGMNRADESGADDGKTVHDHDLPSGPTA